MNNHRIPDIQRHRISTRTPAEPNVWSATGISADLEQQRRERPWRDRIGTRDEWIAGLAIALLLFVILAGLANLTALAVP